MADISIWQKTGHFYFALTGRPYGGIGKDHRIPLAELQCMSPKRVKELNLYLGLGCAARRRGEEPGRARPIESAYGRRPLFRPGP